VVAYYAARVPVFGSGLTRTPDGGFAVQINVDCRPEELPPEPEGDGVPVLVVRAPGGAVLG
jgi:hypothetical protein